MYILGFYFTKIVKELLKSRGEYVMKEGGFRRGTRGGVRGSVTNFHSYGVRILFVYQ